MMKRYGRLNPGRCLQLLALVAGLALLVACGREEPGLTLPTPAIALTPPPAAAPATAPAAAPTAAPIALASATPAPTTAAPEPAATQAVATAAPTVAVATAVPTDAIATAAIPAPGGVEYRVAFVDGNDLLNVRRRPDPAAPVVARLAPDATGINVIGEGQTLLGSSLWLPVETAEGDGWVNSAYLTEVVDPDAFCRDAAVRDLLDRLEAAVANEDGDQLSQLVQPDRGLRLRLNWWNPEIIVRGDDLARLFHSPTIHDWGVEDGSGAPIRGTFRDIALPKLEQDLLGADEWTCDEGRFGPTAGSAILPEGYEAVRFFSAHRSAPAEVEFDWGTWLVGVERWGGRYYISYLVHYGWEI